MRLRSVPIVLVLVLLVGSAGTVRAEHGGGDIDASCSVDNDPVLEDFVGVERGTSFGLTRHYSNRSSSEVTFTATMNDNAFFGSGIFETEAVQPDTGEGFSDEIDTTRMPEATDRVVIEITSDRTGDTILGRCDFTLTVGTDPDGDALYTEWETSGVDADGDGTPDLVLAGEPYEADPEHKDLYLEIDYMEPHRPHPDGIDTVVQAFGRAPVANPDGTGGIDLHVEIDEEVPHSDTTLFPTDFDAIKADHFATAEQRSSPDAVRAKRLVFRYSLWVHRAQWLTGDGRDDVAGLGEVGGNDHIISSEDAHEGPDPIRDSVRLMHEFGHNLGLRHGGADTINLKPNYISAVNNRYTLIPEVDGEFRLDYSDRELDPLDEGRLDERAGLDEDRYIIRWSAGPDRHSTAPGGGPLDWNLNGAIDESFVEADLTRTSPGQTLEGHDDWANLAYGFRSNPASAPLVHPDLPDEPDYETFIQMLEAQQRVFDPTAQAGGPYAAAEGEAVAFEGSAEDLDDPESLSFSWDFGDGTTGTGPTPSHTYGDDGTYEATLTVTDGAGRTDTDTAAVAVSNLDPAASLDTDDAVTFGDGEAFVGRAGDAQDHAAEGNDPGSDDLTFDWSFGASQTYFNDGSGPDPDPSPGGTHPFTASDTQSVTFEEPGLHTIDVTVSDDDGGADSASLPKVVTDDAGCTRGKGHWRHEYSGKGRSHTDEATLLAYLDVVRFASEVFGDVVALDDRDDARDVLETRGQSMRPKAEAQALAAWLNFASGGIGLEEPVDTDGDGLPDTSFRDVMAEVETILGDASASRGDLERAKDLSESANEHNPCDRSER